MKLDFDSIEELKSIANSCNTINEIEARMVFWQQKFDQRVSLKQYGSSEFQYECAMHDNCIFSFKFTRAPPIEGGRFKFRINRSYHQ